MLYLHEIIDIIGDGQQAYLDTVLERAKHSEAEGISRLVGTFRVIGSTHRWPRVVNLWEMDGWAHWAQTLERQFLPSKKDPALGPWWSKAAQWRSGGYDRILEATDFSPRLVDLRAKRLQAWVCVQTLTRTRPGMSDAYLDAIKNQFLPLLEAHRHTLIGAYRVPMRSDEVLTLWAGRDFQSACSFYEQRHDNPEHGEWHRTATALQNDAEAMWLVPAEGSSLHPAE